MAKRLDYLKRFSSVEINEIAGVWFKDGMYDEACEWYSAAIFLNRRATYYINRALTNLKMKRWHLASCDCRKALIRDPNYVKAHFVLGKTLMHLDLYDDGIESMRKAHRLAKLQKSRNVNYIAVCMRHARIKRWNAVEDKRVSQETELETYLNRLINEDMKNRSAKLKLADKDQLKVKKKEIEQECEGRKIKFNNLLSKFDERKRKRHVPDFLYGEIGSEILTDPVITPHSRTYERKNIQFHLRKIGKFDPVTEIKITEDQLITNNAMKAVVREFVKDNKWVKKI